jgi:type II secretory pathway pseudopilin PulG
MLPGVKSARDARGRRTIRRGARHRRARGFTLPEAMNFIALAAVLSALAMYGLARYVRHAKTAEAVGSVMAIAEAAAAYYDGSDATQPAGTTPDAARAMRHFPPPSNGSVPASPEMIRGKRYQSGMADWAGPPWADLRFSIPQPQYFLYSFESQGSGTQAKASAVAHGDLDGDGLMSTYRLGLSVDHATGKARVDKEIEKTDPEE